MSTRYGSDHLDVGASYMASGENNLNSRKTHCLRGHELAGANLMLTKNGNRQCRECSYARAAAYRASENGKAIRKAGRRRRGNIPGARERATAMMADWRASHSEQYVATMRSYSQRNRERHRESLRRWRALRGDACKVAAAEYRKANRSRSAEVGREWRRKNPGKARAIVSARRARLRGAAVGDRKAYAAFVDWARAAKSVPCYWCRKPTKPGKDSRHIDHITPLAKGGADAVGNLCVSCPNCNLTKNAKQPFEFAGQGELRLA